MRNVMALIIVAAVAAMAAPAAQAGERGPVLVPVIPHEYGVASPGRVGWYPYRCSAGPAHNFYHGAFYPEVPALHEGYAYRSYYRYTADRRIPKKYLCAVVE